MVTVGASFVVDQAAGDSLFEVVGTVFGTTASPLVGVFLLGFFVPWSTGLVWVYDFFF